MRVKAAISDGYTAASYQERLDLRWVKAVQKLCSSYQIRLTVPFKALRYGGASASEIKGLSDPIDEALYDLDVEIRVHDAIIGGENYIELNDDWKTRASAYVAHIRDVVSKAEVIEVIRERIFKRLNELQAELDRNRTRVDSITEVFLSITEAVSKGAKHLDGAVKLVERLAGALSGARTARIEHDTQLRLPPPDNLGLSDPQ